MKNQAVFVKDKTTKKFRPFSAFFYKCRKNVALVFSIPWLHWPPLNRSTANTTGQAESEMRIAQAHQKRYHTLFVKKQI
jgi:hypothetical protein